MSCVLAIETSTALGGLALYDGGQPLDYREFTSDRSHNSVIFAPLAAMLKGAPPLECVAVGTGPGSYSGVRVGIAAGMGVSLARNVPLVGVPSICALAGTGALERYAVTGDARRGSWWYAEVINGRMAAPPVVGTAEETAILTGRWPGHLFTIDAASPPFCEARPSHPRADLLACRAAALTEQEEQRLAVQETEPVYLRAPFITVSKKPVFR